MSAIRATRRAAAAAIILALLPLGAALADASHFKNAVRANGHQRGIAAKSSRSARARSNPPSYIDPDTGMSCQNFGGVAVCGPPQGTVKYYDPEQGLNCERTGLVAICSNF
jgi:hypothetical protein